MSEALLLVASSDTNPDMLAASGFDTSATFVWMETAHTRVAVVAGFDVELAKRQSRADQVLAADELTRVEREAGASRDEVDLAVVVNACRQLDVTSVRVPGWFPLIVAEHLRQHGITVAVDAAAMRQRRRRKDAAAVQALADVQGWTEAGMCRVRDALAECAVGADGTLVLDGGPLTSERLRALLDVFFVEHGLHPGVTILAGGAQGADPHEVGRGPLRANEPIVCDLFPRHATSGYHGDMTRTFCVGTPSAEVAAAHQACCDAVALALAQCRPGVSGRGLYDAVCDLFTQRGYPSGASGDDASGWRFPHGLGHGVGLAIHEFPDAGPLAGELLEEGDSLTIEPGLYRRGVGGIRVEDLVVLTNSGARNLNRLAYTMVIGP